MPIVPQNWAEIFLPQQPLLESFVRISVIYLFLFVLLRVVLKREAAGLGIADLLVIVLLADLVQNGMAGAYTTVGDALILAATLILWDWFLNWLGYHNSLFHRFLHQRRLLVIKNGQFLKENARKELLRRQDVEELLRLEGVESISEVKEAYVESNGRLSVITEDEGGGTRRQAQQVEQQERAT